MIISFWKMHGAGNDFILVDDRAGHFPANTDTIATLCRPHTGIGSDGLILIRTSPSADFLMRYFNPDGGEVDMCGNGARCVARLAHDLGTVTLQLPTPTRHLARGTLELPNGQDITYDFLDTGVPHVVVETDDVESCPVVDMGRAIRYHEAFAPAGTNANFVQICSANEIRIRTYERGVEDETLACGTGITAAAITVAMRNAMPPPIAVAAASGDILTVGFESGPAGMSNVKLTGPAEYVFKGELGVTPGQQECNRA